MRKRLLASTAPGLVLGGAVAAGTLIEPMIEPEVIEAATQSSSAGIIVPLALLLMVVLAVGSGGGVPPGPSDRRLKEDVRRIGTTLFGLPLYRFRYRGLKPVFEGVMAQDVERLAPGAVVPLAHGYKAVNYQSLGLRMRQVA